MTFNRSLSLLCIPCIALLVSGAAASRAQDAGAGQASPADKHFVATALKGGMAEVELGQLAAQKGNSDDVKQFGQKMVEDHTKLGDQMKGVAGQIGVTPPTTLSPADAALKAKLSSLSGDAFDKAYIRAMVKGHETDLAQFKKEASGGSSQQVKEAANDGSKVVSMHLDMIKKIAQDHHVASNSAM